MSLRRLRLAPAHEMLRKLMIRHHDKLIDLRIRREIIHQPVQNRLLTHNYGCCSSHSRRPARHSGQCLRPPCCRSFFLASELQVVASPCTALRRTDRAYRSSPRRTYSPPPSPSGSAPSAPAVYDSPCTAPRERQ